MRAGFGATGAIYFALGIVSARVAFLGTRKKEAGIPGALRFLLAQPYGDLLLGAVVAGLAAIAVVHLYEAAGKKRKGLFRLGLAVNGIGYLTLAWAAARLLFHVETGGGSLRKTGVTWLLAESWGAAVLALVGLVVAGGGLWEAWQGVAGRPSAAQGPAAAAARADPRRDRAVRARRARDRAVRARLLHLPRGRRGAIRPACSRWAAPCGLSRTRPSARLMGTIASAWPRTALLWTLSWRLDRRTASTSWALGLARSGTCVASSAVAQAQAPATALEVVFSDADLLAAAGGVRGSRARRSCSPCRGRSR